MRAPVRLLRVRDLPVSHEHKQIRHRFPLRLRHHALRLEVFEHLLRPPHLDLVQPRPLAVPRPAVSAAPEAAEEPKHHVHDEVHEHERQDQQADEQHEQGEEELDDRAQYRVRERLDEPRRQVLRLRAALALPLRERVRARRDRVVLRHVQIVRHAQRRVGQRVECADVTTPIACVALGSEHLSG